MKRGVAVTAATVVAVAAAGAAAVGFGGDEADGTAQQSSLPAATTPVTRQTLIDATTVEGELSFGDAEPLDSKAQGTITWLPAVGATVKRGGTLLRADDRPVLLLYGPLPMYRPLSPGVEGPDVKQFEQNLSALGYDGFTVDDEYTAATASAVKEWQEDLGVTETGSVDATLVTYAPAAVRVAEHSGRVGGPASGEVFTYTGSTKVVTVDVDAGDTAWAVKDARVTVTLPGGKEAAGTIASVGTEAEGSDEEDQPDSNAPGTEDATVPVTVSIADQKALGALERSPVDVRYTAQERTDVLTVPVAALVALAEGGYGLEVVEGGATRYVAVEVGLFADGRVEVQGDGVTEGMTVGLPK